MFLQKIIKKYNDKKQQKIADKQKEIEAQQAYEKRQKMLVAEKYALSFALIQKLVQIYEQRDKEHYKIKIGGFNGWNPRTYVRVETADDKLVYEVLHQKYKPYFYSLDVSNGDCPISFNTYDEDWSFKDIRFDYIKALYDLTAYGTRIDNPGPAIEALKKKQPKPDLQSTDAWPSYRMAVFAHLDTFLQREQ